MPTVREERDVFGYTVFCDDIRMEFDGKHTFVGVYGGRMYVNTPFPVVLPRFGVAITFVQRKDDFVPNLGLRIFLPGDTDERASIEGNLSEAQEGDAMKHAALNPLPDSKRLRLSANLIFTPLVLKQAGIIKVRVLRNDEFIRAGQLAVLQGHVEGDPIPSNEPEQPS